MRRIGARRFYKNEAEYVDFPLIELSEGIIKNYDVVNDCSGEFEWLGGVFIASCIEVDEIDADKVASLRHLDDVKEMLNPSFPYSSPYYLWHLLGVDLATGELKCDFVLRKLD